MTVPLQEYTPDSLHKAEKAFAAARKISPDSLDEIHRHREHQSQGLPTVMHRIAAWIVAPVLAGFAGWMEHQAKLHDHPQLLGVMREGRMLARFMQSLFGTPAQEVWLNRDLGMQAAFGCGDDEALVNWLVRTRIKPLTYAEAAARLASVTYTAADAHEPVDVAGAHRLIEQWKQNGWLNAARDRAAYIAERLFRHWRGIHPERHRPALLMDFASAGNVQRSLQTVLAAKRDKTSIAGLNFAMTAGSRWAEAAGCHMYGFLSEQGAPEWFASAYARTPELMEIFTAAPVGPLTGYAENGKPLFGESFLPTAQKKLLPELQDLIVNAAVFYNREMHEKLTADLSRCLWGRLLLAPSTTEAEALADWPLDTGLDGSAQRVLAARLQGPPETWTKMQTAWPAASQLLS